MVFNMDEYFTETYQQFQLGLVTQKVIKRVEITTVDRAAHPMFIRNGFAARTNPDSTCNLGLWPSIRIAHAQWERCITLLSRQPGFFLNVCHFEYFPNETHVF